MDAVSLVACVNQVAYLCVSEWLGRHAGATKMNENVDTGTTILGVRLPLPSTAVTVFGLTVVPFLHPLLPLVLTSGYISVPHAMRVLLLLGQGLAMLLRYTAMKELGVFFSRSLVVREKQPVIQTGPYRWIRHPGYTATFILHICGSLIVSQNVLALAIVLGVLAAIWSARIANEEDMLRKSLGQPYIDYCRRTARFVPFVF